MSDLTFSVKRVFPGTEAQKKVGIHATFSMSLLNDEGVIAAFQDLKIMKSREGNFYIDSPFRTYEGKDDNGAPKTRKINYVKFFPEEKNWTKQDAIVAMVLAELEKPREEQPKKEVPNTATKPGSKPSTPRSNMPW